MRNDRMGEMRNKSRGIESEGGVVWEERLGTYRVILNMLNKVKYFTVDTTYIVLNSTVCGFQFEFSGKFPFSMDFGSDFLCRICFTYCTITT